MKKGTKIALGVVGGLVVLGGVTRLTGGGDTGKMPDTTTAVTEAATTTITSSTTTATTTTVSTTVSSTAEPVTTTEKPLTVYLLNPKSMKIHYEDCSTIEHPENFVKTTDFQKALDDGYKPCGRCNPIDLNAGR